jgi:hypothetical protein
LRAAQVGHALIAWTLEHGRPPENLVVLQVAGQDELRKVSEKVGGVAFYEPDLGGQLTAIATLGPKKHLREIPLMR